MTAAHTMTLRSRFATLSTLFALLACSNSQAPASSLSIAASYHLRSIGGTQLPFNDGGGGIVDSGHVLRLRGDTVWIDRYTHSLPTGGLPGTRFIAHGTWLGAQSGNIIVLQPLSASSQDTLFVGSGDTLTRHLNSQIELYVAP
jgi:hypothetical protein